MSNALTNWVFEHSRAEGKDRLVLLSIADRADKTGVAWPGIPDIARRARISERSAQRAVKTLQKLGELRVERGGGRKSSRYWVLSGDIAVSPLPGQTNRSAVTNCPPSGDIAVSPPPCHPCHPPGDIAVSPEPPYNPQSTPKEAAPARGVKGSPLPDNFGISDDVEAWAKSKGVDRLKEHLEAFKLKALAKGYLYSDWNAAFKRAVSEDWGGLRKATASNASSSSASNTSSTKPCARCSAPLYGGSTRMGRIGDVCNTCWRAYMKGEWSPEDDARSVADSPNKHDPERAAA